MIQFNGSGGGELFLFCATSGVSMFPKYPAKNNILNFVSPSDFKISMKGYSGVTFVMVQINRVFSRGFF